ncbi:hypothetical protein [Streptomyces tibetensis]|uniref:hypothetical protein n=1 Tax=Streptomyces tibetensis TaxID=2382123 RepID=UPI0033E706D4
MSNELNRRSFVGRATAVAGAAAMAPLLSACGNGGEQQTGSNTASELKKAMPAYVPSQSLKPDIPSVSNGADLATDPGFLRYPTEHPTTVSGVPGKGGKYTAVTPLWGTVPPPGNSFYQAMNKALGVDLTIKPADGNNYATIIPTMTAAKRLPDWIQLPTWWNSQFAVGQLAGTQLADLTPHLSGDKIKKYPNLAAIPTGAWKVGAWRNKLYGIPCGASRSPPTTCSRTPRCPNCRPAAASCSVSPEPRRPTGKATMTSAPQILRWGHRALEVEIGVAEDGIARLTRIGRPGGTPHERRNRPSLPLVEVTAAGHGRAWSGGRLIDTSLGARLRYREHRVTRDSQWLVLTVGTGRCVGLPAADGLPGRGGVHHGQRTPGRIHLSGLLPGLRPDARALVHEAVGTYKAIRTDLADAVPAWPLGLPAWDDPWPALALHTPTTTYVTVWRRPGAEATASLALPHLRSRTTRPDVLYPAASRAEAIWNPDTADLTLTLPTAPSAMLLRLDHTPTPH